MKNLFYLSMSILISCTLLITSSCDKQEMEPNLVPSTTSGENTMGFYVDGELVNIRGKGNWSFPEGVNYFLFENYSCEVSGSLDEQKYPIAHIRLSFDLDSINPMKPYYLNEDEPGNGSIIDNSQLGGEEYNTIDSCEGVIEILRFDTEVIAGTFNFDAKNGSSGRIIKIKNGRFDIKRN